MKKVVFCRCIYSDAIDERRKKRILALLMGSDLDCEFVDDLCDMAARCDSRLCEWAREDHLVLVACHSRALRWLFRLAGARLDPKKATVVNMHRTDAKQRLRDVLGETLLMEIPSGLNPGQTVTEPDWIPWFPVIDYDRCRSCGKCVDFCLFGVYGTGEDGTVKVTNPSQCKNLCPACSRICPEQAVIFPKFTQEPYNGAEIELFQYDTRDDPRESGRVLSAEEEDREYQALLNRKRTNRKRLFGDDANGDEA